MCNRKGLIYSIKNTINNKVYVGKTICGLDRRMAQHFSKMRSGIDHLLYNDMRLFGEDKFITEVLESDLLEKELCNREKYWISRLNTTNADFGYNYQSGGETDFTNHPRSILKEAISKGSTPFLIYNLHGEFIGEFISRTEASKVTKVDRRRIGLFLNGKISKCKYVFIYKHNSNQDLLYHRIRETKKLNNIKILVVNSKTKEPIGVYNNVDLASKDLSIPNSLIYPVLNGNRFSTNGYVFSYIVDKEMVECR